MSTNVPLNKNLEPSQTAVESWGLKIIPTLKTHWADYILGLPAAQPLPSFNDWLSVLYAADTNPDQLSKYLHQLLNFSQEEASPARGWTLLTDLLNVTSKAASSEAASLTSANWQSILEIQIRVLKAAAKISPQDKIPSGQKNLSRKALYLQTITKLEKKFEAGLLQDNLLDAVVELIQQGFNYEYVHFFLLLPEKQTLTLRHAAWKSRQFTAKDVVSLNLEQGIVGRAAATGQGTLINDVSKTPHYVAHPALPDIKAQLSVPVLTQQDLIGVLDIKSDQADAFSDDDYTILQALSNYLATKLENIRLKGAQKRYAKEQALIYDTIITLGTYSNMDTVLRRMTQKITLAMKAGACVICQIDENSRTISALAEYVLRHPGNPAHTWRPIRVPTPIAKDPIAKQTLTVARPAISRAKNIKKTSTNLLWRVPAGRKKNTQSRWNVVLAIPFEVKSKITGLIEIYDKNPNRLFSPEDVQLCRILATQTAMAIEQARLFDETVNRLSEVSMLYTMSQQIATSLDLDEVLNTIVNSLRKAIGCRACCIFLLDETEQQLEIKAADGLKPHWQEYATLRLGEGVAGQVAVDAQTVYVPNTAKDPNFIVFDEEVKSLMVVPLIAHGKVIGTINVDDKLTDAFGPMQERLLTIAATQAGISIENAQLFTKISAERKQMQAIIQHMADGLLLIDKQSVIITCNSALAMMLDMHRGQIIGTNTLSPNIFPNLAKITASATQQRARTGVLAQEVTINSPRPRILQVFTTSLTNDENHHVGEVRVVHDVTKERELEQLKDDFFSTISHELRTPLFSIQGFAQILMEEPPIDRETQKEFLNTIQRQAMQLTEMVNNLLDISKINEDKMALDKKPVSLIDVINQTILKLQGYAHQQKVTLNPRLPAAIPTIIGDSQRIEQVLTNLIGNAIKFSPPQKSVTITAKLDTHQVLVQVKDKGIGIPPESLESIFSRYYQVHNKSERSAMGTGLGLHIAKQIVEGHKGRIWAESTGEDGSTFCFTLPLPT